MQVYPQRHGLGSSPERWEPRAALHSTGDTKGTASLGYQIKTAIRRDKLNGLNKLTEIKERQESALNKVEFELGK